ncbi:hypothetical protein [Allofrancisella frigidaquae]|uniref:Uncharacterized protein n=1 Tax=Allofrancisella frigidaquae TaxID=1085644 RepID=A0A6M3HY57_9GAMM|nr:hypothetical protein [Allofrancisella frigidaquae]QIV94586.1 hypothetical protein E3E15_04115 [Allofrancisella frigidaquae]
MYYVFGFRDQNLIGDLCFSLASEQQVKQNFNSWHNGFLIKPSEDKVKQYDHGRYSRPHHIKCGSNAVGEQNEFLLTLYKNLNKLKIKPNMKYFSYFKVSSTGFTGSYAKVGIKEKMSSLGVSDYKFSNDSNGLDPNRDTLVIHAHGNKNEPNYIHTKDNEKISITEIAILLKDVFIRFGKKNHTFTYKIVLWVCYSDKIAENLFFELNRILKLHHRSDIKFIIFGYKGALAQRQCFKYLFNKQKTEFEIIGYKPIEVKSKGKLLSTSVWYNNTGKSMRVYVSNNTRGKAVEAFDPVKSVWEREIEENLKEKALLPYNNSKISPFKSLMTVTQQAIEEDILIDNDLYQITNENESYDKHIDSMLPSKKYLF